MHPILIFGLLKTAYTAVLTPRSTNGCINPSSQQEFVDLLGCPRFPSFDLDSNGTCVNNGPDKIQNRCTSYCETSLSWFYGGEVPFETSQCSPNTSCVFSQDQKITTTNTYAFDGGISLGSPLGAFHFGASYSYSKSVSTSESLSQPRPSATLAYCGYWTFLPYYIKSCGTMSARSLQYVHVDTWSNAYGQGGGEKQCVGSYQTNNETCNSTPYQDTEGGSTGAIVFVATSCDTNARLPMTLQDPRYAQSGVAMSES